MNFKDHLSKVINALMDDEENIKKGDAFEKYVANLFPEENYTIIEWTTDTMRKHNRYVEADTRPDLMLRHNATSQEFYVECKYRSYPIKGKIQWSTKEQISRYRNFAKDKKVPVFVVIGVGGSPTKPENMFCLKIENAEYPELYINYIRKFQRHPERSFYLNGTVIY